MTFVHNQDYAKAQSELADQVKTVDKLHKQYDVEMFRTKSGELVCEFLIRGTNVAFTVGEYNDTETGIRTVGLYRPKGLDEKAVSEPFSTHYGVVADSFHDLAALACAGLGIIWNG
tara:strand:- start:85 stop:432 length:348 start_codon:yes stop_codon:yes gene_type:complete